MRALTAFALLALVGGRAPEPPCAASGELASRCMCVAVGKPRTTSEAIAALPRQRAVFIGRVVALEPRTDTVGTFEHAESARVVVDRVFHGVAVGDTLRVVDLFAMSDCGVGLVPGGRLLLVLEAPLDSLVSPEHRTHRPLGQLPMVAGCGWSNPVEYAAADIALYEAALAATRRDP